MAVSSNISALVSVALVLVLVLLSILGFLLLRYLSHRAVGERVDIEVSQYGLLYPFNVTVFY